MNEKQVDYLIHRLMNKKFAFVLQESSEISSAVSLGMFA